MTASFLINRTPSALLNGKTPYEILFGKHPNYSIFRTFGCLCYAHVHRRDKDKFGDRSRKCIFVGYPFGQKGWRVYDIEREEYFVSCDVVFSEHVFPYGEEETSFSIVPVARHEQVVVDDEFIDERVESTTARESNVENESDPP